jgi:hypothetical protein
MPCDGRALRWRRSRPKNPTALENACTTRPCTTRRRDRLQRELRARLSSWILQTATRRRSAWRPAAKPRPVHHGANSILGWPRMSRTTPGNVYLIASIRPGTLKEAFRRANADTGVARPRMAISFAAISNAGRLSSVVSFVTGALSGADVTRLGDGELAALVDGLLATKSSSMPNLGKMAANAPRIRGPHGVDRVECVG